MGKLTWSHFITLFNHDIPVSGRPCFECKKVFLKNRNYKKHQEMVHGVVPN